MKLDHVSYAVSNQEFADTVQRLGSLLGSAMRDGGKHPRFGTKNFVLPLQGGMYFEVVTALDHPAADQAPFGQAVRSRATEGGGWLGWVVSVSDLPAVEKRLGRKAVEGHRVRPDGYDLKWRQLGVNDLISDPQLPFFIEWDSPQEEHPSKDADHVFLKSIEISGDEILLADFLGEPANHPLENIDVVWVDSETQGVVAVTFETAAGTFRIE
jgi:hypothetical protein